MGQWQGKLFVFRDQKGRHHVATTYPDGFAVHIEVFQVTGPYKPIANVTIVDDVSKWLDNLENEGFTMQPSSSLPGPIVFPGDTFGFRR